MKYSEEIKKLQKISDIEQIVALILDYCQQTTPPINIKSICEKYNIGLNQVDFSVQEKELGKQISGALSVRDGSADILINKSEYTKRQLFTCAHELGHLILHPPQDGELSVSFRSFSNDKERAANKFAAELLMPKEMVKKEYMRLVYPAVSSLANIFGVSNAAMAIRLKELGFDYIDI